MDTEEDQERNMPDTSQMCYSIYYYSTKKRRCFVYATGIKYKDISPFVNILNACDLSQLMHMGLSTRKRIYFCGDWIYSYIEVYKREQTTSDLELKQVYIRVSEKIQWHEAHSLDGVDVKLLWNEPRTLEPDDIYTPEDIEWVITQNGNRKLFIWDTMYPRVNTDYEKVISIPVIKTDEKTNKRSTLSKMLNNLPKGYVYNLLQTRFLPTTPKTGECYFTYSPPSYNFYLDWVKLFLDMEISDTK